MTSLHHRRQGVIIDNGQPDDPAGRKCLSKRVMSRSPTTGFLLPIIHMAGGSGENGSRPYSDSLEHEDRDVADHPPAQLAGQRAAASGHNT